MKDLTPNTRLKAQRGCVIRTRSWDQIIEHYQKATSFVPMLRLVQALSASPLSPQLFAATSMFDLLLSDSADFRLHDNTLRISYHPETHQFTFLHQSFSGRDDQRECSEPDARQTLRLFVRLKFGLLLDPPA